MASVTVAGAVEGIEDVVFDANDITSISVGQDILKRMLWKVFPNSCSSINTLNIIGSVPYLYKQWMLSEDPGSFVLPNAKNIFLERVKVIAAETFFGLESLTSIRLPKSLEHIEYDVFAGINGKLPNVTKFTVEDLSSWCKVELENKFSNPCYSMSNGAITDEQTEDEVSTLDATTIGGVDVVSSYTFTNCQSLASVNLPDTVTEIGNGAFSDCRSLETVILPHSVSVIFDEAFDGCSSISSLTAPAGLDLTYLGANVFRGCSSSLFDTVTIPGCSVFAGYIVDATSVPSSLDFTNTNIKGFASSIFNGNQNIQTVILGNNFTILQDYSFRGCSNLSSVTLPQSIRKIGEYAFAESGLTSVSIPDDITEIGDGCFESCYSLSSITIGNGISIIPDFMFECCTAISSITIPSNIKVIGKQAFSMNDVEQGGAMPNNLQHVAMTEGLDEIGQSAFSFCTEIEEVNIPDSVRFIKEYAFQNSGLATITFGQGLQELGSLVLSDCTNLSEMIFHGNAPTVGTKAFENVPNTCTVKIKSGTTGWVIEDGKWNGFTVEYYN
ncbi:MAG: leucine-rich repeat protein [Prevotella sp.]|nr:leucine-rich repeat protein [Prevotella sp.]